MPRFINPSKVPLALAVWLAHDGYDYDPNVFSATALIRPVRQAILSRRVPTEKSVVDVNALVKSRAGHAIHDSLEMVWNEHYREAMSQLGYDEQTIDRIVVNPNDDEVLAEDAIPIYTEQRYYRELDGVTISGKIDFVAESQIQDFKNTSTFVAKHGAKLEDYCLQGSIYRWLAPNIITEDDMLLHWIFFDWMASKVKSEKNYPATPTLSIPIPLMSLDETEQWLKNRLAQHAKYRDADESEIPECNDKELWRKATSYKYYRNPQSYEEGKRCSNSCASRAEADALVAKHGKGIVVEVPGQVVACRYCAGFHACTQKDRLIEAGDLTL